MTQALRPYYTVLKNWHFTKLWFTQICTQLTRFILGFVILIEAFKLTNGSSLAVSLVLVAFGLATVVFGGLAGVYADRFDKRKLLIMVSFAQALCILAFIPFENSYTALLVITFLYSSFNQFYLPAELPSIPHLVSQESLLIANSFFSFTANLSMVVGFAAAGPLTLAFGVTSTYWLSVVLMVLAGLAAFMLPSLKPHDDHPHKSLFFQNVWGEFVDGVKSLAESKKVHFSFTALICAQVFNGMLITLAPAFVSKVLQINLEQGTLFMILPLVGGILLGTLALGWEGRFLTKKRMVRIGFAGCGVMTFLIALLVGPHNYWLYVVLAFILGIFNTYIFAPSHSLLQENVGEHIRGRIYSSLFFLLQIAATLPTVIIGILADFTSISVILGGLGVLLGAFSLVVGTEKDPITEPIQP